jgi:hypothetical protein
MAGTSKGKQQRRGSTKAQQSKGAWRLEGKQGMKRKHAQADAGKLHPVNGGPCLKWVISRKKKGKRRLLGILLFGILAS